MKALQILFVSLMTLGSLAAESQTFAAWDPCSISTLDCTLCNAQIFRNSQKCIAGDFMACQECGGSFSLLCQYYLEGDRMLCGWDRWSYCGTFNGWPSYWLWCTGQE